jgi:hypothetical protein
VNSNLTQGVNFFYGDVWWTETFCADMTCGSHISAGAGCWASSDNDYSQAGCSGDRYNTRLGDLDDTAGLSLAATVDGGTGEDYLFNNLPSDLDFGLHDTAHETCVRTTSQGGRSSRVSRGTFEVHRADRGNIAAFTSLREVLAWHAGMPVLAGTQRAPRSCLPCRRSWVRIPSAAYLRIPCTSAGRLSRGKIKPPPHIALHFGH